MRARLADEVNIRDSCQGNPEPSLGRLSFVSHSVGGLIGSQCLAALGGLKDQMVTFLSLCATCATQTPCSKHSSGLPRIFDDRMLGAAVGDGRHGCQQDFPEPAGSRWGSGALSVRGPGSQC